MAIIKKRGKKFIQTVEELHGFHLGDLVVCSDDTHGFARDTIYEIFELSYDCLEDGTPITSCNNQVYYMDARIKPVFMFFNAYSAVYPDLVASSTKYTLVNLCYLKKLDLVTLLKNKVEFEAIIQRLVQKNSTVS